MWLSRLLHDHQPVALPQPVETQRQPAQLILAIRVRSRHIDQQFRMKHGHRSAISIAQPVQILFVAHAVRQMNVKAGRRLFRRVIVELVNGQREHGDVARENTRRSVSMVHIAIHNHGALDGAISAVALHGADGHRDVVDRAKTLAMSRERVMESAAHVKPDALLERQARGQHAAARPPARMPPPTPGCTEPPVA